MGERKKTEMCKRGAQRERGECGSVGKRERKKKMEVEREKDTEQRKNDSLYLANKSNQ